MLNPVMMLEERPSAGDISHKGRELNGLGWEKMVSSGEVTFLVKWVKVVSSGEVIENGKEKCRGAKMRRNVEENKKKAKIKADGIGGKSTG